MRGRTKPKRDVMHVREGRKRGKKYLDPQVEDRKKKKKQKRSKNVTHVKRAGMNEGTYSLNHIET